MCQLKEDIEQGHIFKGVVYGVQPPPPSIF